MFRPVFPASAARDFSETSLRISPRNPTNHSHVSNVTTPSRTSTGADSSPMDNPTTSRGILQNQLRELRSPCLAPSRPACGQSTAIISIRQFCRMRRRASHPCRLNSLECRPEICLPRCANKSGRCHDFLFRGRRTRAKFLLVERPDLAENSPMHRSQYSQVLRRVV